MVAHSIPSSPIRGPSLRAFGSALDFDLKTSVMGRKRNNSLRNFVCSVTLGTIISLAIQIIVMSRTPCRLMQASIHTIDFLNGKSKNVQYKPNYTEKLNSDYLRERLVPKNGLDDGEKLILAHPGQENKVDNSDGGVSGKKSQDNYKEDGPMPNAARNENLVLIGVMTARKFLNTRVLAGHRTWVKDIPGRVIYFCSDVRTSLSNDTRNDVDRESRKLPLSTQEFHYSPADIKSFKPLEVSTNKDPMEYAYGSSKSGSAEGDMPLVISLPGVNDDYPPQKKSFMMFKFMHENFGHQFQWFVRADDDVYIKGNKLGKLLRSLDSNEPYYIGQTGQGKKEELGTLHLNYDENFCMGGPSMILSRETLKRMAPHIKYCLNHLYTSHEDVEIGRCVKTFANIPCTWSYETQWLFYHYSSSNSIWIRKSARKSKRAYKNAITLHPFKTHTSFYDAHTYYKTQKMERLRNRMWHLKNFLKTHPINPVTGTNKNPISAKDGGIKVKSFIPISSHIIQNSLILAVDRSNPRRKIDPEIKDQIEELRTQIMEHLNHLARHDGIIFNKVDLFWAYHTSEDTKNYRYFLNLGLTYRKFGGTKNWLEAPFDIKIPFQDLIFEEISINSAKFSVNNEALTPEALDMATYLRAKLKENVLDNLASYLWNAKDAKGIELTKRSADQSVDETIHFIVPLFERLENFKRFLHNYESVCLKRGENAELLVVMFHPNANNGQGPNVGASKEAFNLTDGNLNTPADDYAAAVFKLIDAMRSTYTDHKSRLKILSIKGEFSRGLALEIGASQYKDEHLLFFVDVDMVFGHDFLYRARSFTQFNQSIYYPAVLSQFNAHYKTGPDPARNQANLSTYFRITDQVGYWRLYGFGIVSIYKHDFRRAGGFDMSILGWGKEDVDLYDKCLYKGYTIYRCPDPDLVHVFHDNDCPTSLENDQFLMCVKSKANNLGSVSNLAQFLYSV